MTGMELVRMLVGFSSSPITPSVHRYAGAAAERPAGGLTAARPAGILVLGKQITWTPSGGDGGP